MGGTFLPLPPSFFPSSSLQGSYRVRTAPWGGRRAACPRETCVRSSHVYVSLGRPIGLSTHAHTHTHTNTSMAHIHTFAHGLSTTDMPASQPHTDTPVNTSIKAHANTHALHVGVVHMYASCTCLCGMQYVCGSTQYLGGVVCAFVQPCVHMCSVTYTCMCEHVL